MKASDPATIDPMQAFLTGMLLGMLDKEGRQYMKIVKLENARANGFEVLLASGLRLAVKIEVLEKHGEPQ